VPASPDVVEVQERQVDGGRLDRETIEPGAAAGHRPCQGGMKRRLVHQPAARGVQDDCRGFHGNQFLGADHATCRLR